jgi:hypothetical protein
MWSTRRTSADRRRISPSASRCTLVDVSGRASVALASVSLTSESGQTVPLAATGHAFAGRFTADHSARLRWLASGTTGPVADLPAPLELEVQPDSVPHVEITAPTGDTVLAADVGRSRHRAARTAHRADRRDQ